jgi:hypothetical protein
MNLVIEHDKVGVTDTAVVHFDFHLLVTEGTRIVSEGFQFAACG